MVVLKVTAFGKSGGARPFSVCFGAQRKKKRERERGEKERGRDDDVTAKTLTISQSTRVLLEKSPSPS